MISFWWEKQFVWNLFEGWKYCLLFLWATPTNCPGSENIKSNPFASKKHSEKTGEKVQGFLPNLFCKLVRGRRGNRVAKCQMFTRSRSFKLNLPKEKHINRDNLRLVVQMFPKFNSFGKLCVLPKKILQPANSFT